MKISKEIVFYRIIGLLAGSLITIIAATTAVNNHNDGMMKMTGMYPNSGNSGNMQNMNNTNMPGMNQGGM